MCQYYEPLHLIVPVYTVYKLDIVHLIKMRHTHPHPLTHTQQHARPPRGQGPPTPFFAESRYVHAFVFFLPAHFLFETIIIPRLIIPCRRPSGYWWISTRRAACLPTMEACVTLLYLQQGPPPRHATGAICRQLNESSLDGRRCERSSWVRDRIGSAAR